MPASRAAPNAADRGASFGIVLLHREFRGLWLAQVTSLIGDQLAKLALAILVFRQSDNALLASLAYAVSYLPALVVGPASGLLTDILPRRRVLLLCDLGRAGLIGLMCIPGVPIGALLGIALVAASFESPFGSARAALLPDILDADSYPVAQSITSVTEQAGQIVGFGIGGLLVGALSARGALAVDAVTFVLSALLVLAYVRPRQAVTTRTAGGIRGYWHDSALGARVIHGDPYLRDLMAVTCFGLFGFIATEGMAVPYAHQIGTGSVGAGLLAASVPFGSAFGVWALTRFVPASRRILSVRRCAVLWPGPLFFISLHPGIAVSMTLWALSGALIGYVVLVQILLMSALSAESRGRAYAFARALVTASQGVGLAAAGAVAELFSPSIAVTAAALFGFVGCLWYAGGLSDSGRHRKLNDGRSSRSPSGRNRGMPVVSEPAVPSRPARGPSRDAAPRSASLEGGPQPKKTNRREIICWIASIATLGICLFLAQEDLFAEATTSVSLHFSWWVLVIGILVVESFAVPFQRGPHVTMVSLSQVPIVIALFFVSPRNFIFAAILGAALISLRRRRKPVMFAMNIAICAAAAAAAIETYEALAPAGRVTWATLGAGFLGAVADDLCSVVAFIGFRKIIDPKQRVGTIAPAAGFSLIAGAAGASLGLLTVVAMLKRPSYGWLLAMVAFFVIAGSRAYNELREQHQDLGQLYEFKEQLGPLLPQAAILAPVLQRTLEILNASKVELVLLDGPDAVAPEGLRRVLSLEVGGQLREFWRQEQHSAENASDPSKSITVTLGSSTTLLGTLTARDRQGQGRGFRRADLRLLETLAGHVSDALERGELIARLQDAATHDALTGLLTLAELSRRVDEHLLHGESIVVGLVDVARLKDVNDSLGHEAGDALLRTVATLLVEYASTTALLARSGGGEFAVAVPGVHGFHAAAAIDRIADGLTGLVDVLGVTVDLRTRTGWVFAPRDGRDAATLLRRADLALGAAKRGLQRATRFSPDLEVDGLRRLRLVNDLRAAIDARQIDVVYQPLVTPGDGRIIGAEALARWNHRELGPLQPDEFIIVAEQSGLIGALTEHVLDHALAQTARWAREGRSLRVAVNLSARCLSDLSLPGTVLDLLARHQVDSDRLTLEVTETSVAEDPTRAELVLERLRNLGVRLSIDDFGTGYSSLASLKRFPVQEVKLDRQFLAGLVSSADESMSEDLLRDEATDIALLTAVVALGHSLGLEIVAEGVETGSAYERLRDLGVDVLQGYFIGRPAAGADLQQWFVCPEQAEGSHLVPRREPSAASTGNRGR